MTIHAKAFRWNMTDHSSLSVAHFGDYRCHIIERPWIDDGTPGGKSFESCVPSGIYELLPYTRNNGDEVYALVNEELGVYYHYDDVPGDSEEEKRQNGRWAVLIHVGNWVRDVVGCLAPARGQGFDSKTGEPMVNSSGRAVKEIMSRLNKDVNNTLEIIEL